LNLHIFFNGTSEEKLPNQPEIKAKLTYLVYHKKNKRCAKKHRRTRIFYEPYITPRFLKGSRRIADPCGRRRFSTGPGIQRADARPPIAVTWKPDFNVRD
jgi:hypothetical protein